MIDTRELPSWCHDPRHSQDSGRCTGAMKPTSSSGTTWLSAILASQARVSGGPALCLPPTPANPFVARSANSRSPVGPYPHPLLVWSLRLRGWASSRDRVTESGHGQRGLLFTIYLRAEQYNMHYCSSRPRSGLRGQTSTINTGPSSRFSIFPSSSTSTSS